MHTTAPALPVELPPHSLPLPRVLAALAATVVVAASALVGVAAPAAADGENVIPLAVDDAYSTPMSTQLVVANPGFLSNDVDPDSTLTLLAVDSAGIAGTVFANNGGGFTYNPTPGFTGTTSFQYRAMEVGTNQFSDWATVTITVDAPAAPNAIPVTVADSYTTAYETPLVVSAVDDLLLNDSDADGDPLVAVSNWVSSVGTLTAYSDQGTFTYSPPAGFSGDAMFTYRAFDHKAQGNLVTVTITVLPPAEPVVNTPPVGVDDWFFVTPGENFSLNGVAVLINDSDANGDPISAQWVNTLPGDAVQSLNGSIAWSVPADFCGVFELQYRPFDGVEAGNLTTIEFRAHSEQIDGLLECDDPAPPLNSAPVAVDDAHSVQPGQTLTVAALSGVLSNDTDADGDDLAAILVAAPVIGSGFVLDATGSFSWTAPAGFCGETVFTYVAADATSESSVATVRIIASDERGELSCPEDEEGEGGPSDQPGSPTIPTLPEPTEPQTPSGDPDLTDQPGTPGRDTLADTGAGDLTAGIGWGAILALMLGFGLVAPRVRGNRGRA